MYNLQFLEKETWADTSRFGKHKTIHGDRLKLFKLLDVPNNVMENMLFSKQTVEVNERLQTFESLRSFHSLPRWLKKKMKFRLRNAFKKDQFPELKEFVTNL